MKTPHDLGHLNRIGALPEGALNLCRLLAPLSPLVVGTTDNSAAAIYQNHLMLMQQLKGILPIVDPSRLIGYEQQSLHRQPLYQHPSDKLHQATMPTPWTADRYLKVNAPFSLADDRGGRSARRTVAHTSPSTTQKNPQGSVSPSRFNPFAKCEPLTADVDTNRLYPRVNRTSSSSSRPALNDLNMTSPTFHSVLTSSTLACNQGDAICTVSRRKTTSQQVFKSVDYLVDMMSVDSRECSNNNKSCISKQMTDDDETGPSGTSVEHLDVPQYVRALADRVSSITAAGAVKDTVCHNSMATNSDVVSSTLNSSNGRNSSLGRFQCLECPKSYSTVGGLMKHRQFYCPTQAASSTTTLQPLQQQQQQQPRRSVASKSGSSGCGEPRDQRCPQCDKSYSSASALKMHIRTHTLPCRCRLCGKAFSRPWLLQGHLRTHTGEKPFECPHCSRAFADRSNLRAHLQTHYDVKQYNCAVCRRTFSRMSLLLKHRYGPCSANPDSATGSGAEQSSPVKSTTATNSCGNVRLRMDASVGRRW